MKDLRKLIRKVLKEETNQSDVDLDIMDYEGDDKEINRMRQAIYYGNNLSKNDIEYAQSFFNKKDENNVEELIKKYSGSNKKINDTLKKKVFSNSPLTPKQKKGAEDFFMKEKLSKTSLANLKKDTPLGKEVIKQGIETYLGLIKSGKKHLFKSRKELSIVIGNPSPEWVEKNIKDLKEFRKKLSKKSLEKDYVLVGGETVKLSDKIDEILGVLTKNPNSYVGFIENGEWSIMNKLDTNYVNWFRMLKELDSMGKLKGNNPNEKVEYFFKQSPVESESVLNKEKLYNLRLIEEKFGVKIPTLSLADIEILKDYNKDFLNIKERLMGTTREGERVEGNVIGSFKLFSGGSIREDDIYDFSSYGNRVDQIFGVDMMVNMYLPGHGEEKYWVPIQVKSRRENAYYTNLTKSDIGGIAVFETSNKEISGNLGYFTTVNGTEKSFQDLLDYNECRKTDDVQSCKKYDK
jgi:hypothetical protein